MRRRAPERTSGKGRGDGYATDRTVPAVRWTDVRLGLPNVLVLLAVVGAGSFAAGSAMPAGTSGAASRSTEPSPAREEQAEQEAVDDPAQRADEAPAPPLTWVAPPRWQLVPNASSMRLATYRVPHAPGDTVDAELSITQAGGTAEANAKRWIGQFGPSAEKTAKESRRRVGPGPLPLEVVVVDVAGTYAGGMGNDDAPREAWALLGAIVLLPQTRTDAPPAMPVFFKLVGPEKSVAAARGEFEAMIGSLAPR